jgi:hypothetical protein
MSTRDPGHRVTRGSNGARTWSSPKVAADQSLSVLRRAQRKFACPDRSIRRFIQRDLVVHLLEHGYHYPEARLDSKPCHQGTKD